MQPPKNFVAEPFEYHQEVEVTVESLTNLGMGVARVDGWVVMVPFVIPGERVTARIYRNFQNYSDADLVEVLEASPDRVEPRCPAVSKMWWLPVSAYDLCASAKGEDSAR